MTVLAKLVAEEEDIMKYVTYVFEVLDEEYRQKAKYIMCTRFPNWQCRKINIDDIGYLEVFEIRAGIDKWFDGSKMIPYNYNNIQFIKFIPKPTKDKNKYII